MDLDGIILADGFEKELVGVAHPATLDGVPIAVYSADLCIQKLMVANDWEFDEALEYFVFNTEQTMVGKQTPMFVWNVGNDERAFLFAHKEKMQ